MSERETVGNVSLQQWRGMDQRTQPTNVQDGFFTSARGVYFGLGDNAERLPGKVLHFLLAQGVFGIYVFQQLALLQTQTKLLAMPLADLFNPPADTLQTEDGDNIQAETGDELEIDT